MHFFTKPYDASDMSLVFPEGIELIMGRPHINLLVSIKVRAQIGSMAVTSCGPGAIGDDVRRSCRNYQSSSDLDYYEEGFYW
jgi:hypothetical protein